MKIAIVAMVVACGSTPPPVIGAAPPTPIEHPVTSPPIVASTGTCEPSPASGVLGSHDRFAFEDPQTHHHGYKDRAGNVAIAATFADAADFTAGGIGSVRLDDHSANPFRFIDPSGKVLATPFKFDNGADYFQEGFARIVDGAGKVGFIALDGAIVVAPRYDFAYPFCHGTARTALDGRAGYLDPRGQPTAGPAGDDRPLIPPSHDD